LTRESQHELFHDRNKGRSMDGSDVCKNSLRSKFGDLVAVEACDHSILLCTSLSISLIDQVGTCNTIPPYRLRPRTPASGGKTLPILQPQAAWWVDHSPTSKSSKIAFHFDDGIWGPLGSQLARVSRLRDMKLNWSKHISDLAMITSVVGRNTYPKTLIPA
jgi:hypothetical protein